jgi:hypothetical protein
MANTEAKMEAANVEANEEAVARLRPSSVGTLRLFNVVLDMESLFSRRRDYRFKRGT